MNHYESLIIIIHINMSHPFFKTALDIVHPGYSELVNPGGGVDKFLSTWGWTSMGKFLGVKPSKKKGDFWIGSANPGIWRFPFHWISNGDFLKWIWIFFVGNGDFLEDHPWIWWIWLTKTSFPFFSENPMGFSRGLEISWIRWWITLYGKRLQKTIEHPPFWWVNQHTKWPCLVAM